MKAGHLATNKSTVKLVEPDVERDAPLSVAWLSGDEGRDTLRAMGVSDKDNKPTTLEAERSRVEGFISKPNQLNWQIALKDTVIGAIWVDLEPTDHLGAPAIHLMIGDKSSRGKGAGSAALQAVLDYLQSSGTSIVHSRHLTDNIGAKKLLEKLNFEPIDSAYKEDDLEWQNVTVNLST